MRTVMMDGSPIFLQEDDGSFSIETARAIMAWYNGLPGADLPLEAFFRSDFPWEPVDACHTCLTPKPCDCEDT